MSILSDLAAGLATGAVEVIDLTAPLSAETPVIQLPEQFGQSARFELEEISRYDDRGPAWYWNNFRSGEHTGTHFDAPNHWVTGQGKDDVASVPAGRLIAPAVAGGTVVPEITVDSVGSVENAAKVIAALHSGEKRLVFVDSRRLAEELGTMLRGRGITTFVSHSSLSAAERRESEQAFAEARDELGLAPARG